MREWECDICGRPMKKKIRLLGHTLCSKHMHQFWKYGCATDCISRTNADLNDYDIIDTNTTLVHLYNQRNIRIASAIIDSCDLDLIKFKKWRLSHSHVVTGSGSGKTRELSHVILGIPKENDACTVVDHINGNRLDNRKCNLRICSQAENVRNKRFMSNNTIGVIGVSYDKKRNAYTSEIRYDEIRCHLPRRKILAEAVWQRIAAEDLLFGEFVNQDARNHALTFCTELSDERKKELTEQVSEKIQAKFGE